MNSFERDPLSTLEDNIKLRLTNGDQIEHRFLVVPLDTPVKDPDTPELIVTRTKLFHVYDEVIEEYMLNDLDMEILGERPKFTIWQILLEGNFSYSLSAPEDYMKLKSGEHFTRLTINESQQVPKDFMLREGALVARGYQNWAFARLILNVRDNITTDATLLDMLKGWFVLFNQRTVVAFAGITTMYFLMRLLIIPLLPDFFAGILDVIFGILALLMGAWVVLSVNKNLERYQAAYGAYSTTPAPTA